MSPSGVLIENIENEDISKEEVMKLLQEALQKPEIVSLKHRLNLLHSIFFSIFF